MSKAAGIVLRATSAVLWAVLLIVYVAAKINFFTRYRGPALGSYVLQHGKYWLGMAAVAFVIWIVKGALPQECQ